MIITALTFCLCLAIVAKFEQSNLCHAFPSASLMVLLGFVCSEIIVALGFDTGIRYHNFAHILALFFIPSIVFVSAISIDIAVLKQDRRLIVAIGIILPLFSLVLVALLLYAFINHPSGFPLKAAFVCASLLIATNSQLLNSFFSNYKQLARLQCLIQIESLLSSLIALVLFNLLVNIASNEMHIPSRFLLHLTNVFISSSLIGIVTAWCLQRLIINNTVLFNAMLLCFVYGLFALCEYGFQGSGAMAVIAFGLTLNHQGMVNVETQRYWQVNTKLATLAIYFLLGVTITLSMFSHRYLAMLFGIFAILVSRNILLFAITAWLNATQKIKPLSLSQQLLLSLSANKGALLIALVLMLPQQLNYWWTIQAIVYGAVIFTLFIQAPITMQLTKKYSMR